MSRVTLGLVTASLFGLAAVQPAAAGCCNWGGSCCSSGYVAYQPVYVQPAPTVVQMPPQQVIVQMPQPQVIVQQPQPQVWFQQSAPVATYTVDHGPYYAGPEAINYAPTPYYVDRPARAYPYMPAYQPYGYRPYRHGYRAYKYGAWRAHKQHRWAYRHHRYMKRNAY